MNIIDQILSARNKFIMLHNINPTTITLGVEAHFQLEKELSSLTNPCFYFNATTREIRGMIVNVSHYLPVDAVEVK